MDIHCFFSALYPSPFFWEQHPKFFWGERVGGLTTLTPSVHMVQIGLASNSRYEIGHVTLI